MTISVVIPAYNEEKLLPRCLESLSKQTLPKNQFEMLVIVDKATTDKTKDISKKYGASVCIEPRRGITFARQRGVEQAQGDIIVGTDADCELPTDFLEKILYRFHDKSISGICGAISLENPRYIIGIMNLLFVKWAHLYSKIFGKTPICWAMNFSFRKKDFIEIGGYPLNLPLLVAGLDAQGSDEYEFLKKFIKQKKKIIFDTSIHLKTSSRRFQKRLLYWLFVEYILGYIINPQLYKFSGRFIRIPSTSEKIIPSLAYNYALYGLFISLCISFLYGFYMVFGLINTQKSLPLTTQAEIKKIIAIRTEISQGFTTSKARIEALLEERGIYLR